MQSVVSIGSSRILIQKPAFWHLMIFSRRRPQRCGGVLPRLCRMSHVAHAGDSLRLCCRYDSPAAAALAAEAQNATGSRSRGPSPTSSGVPSAGADGSQSAATTGPVTVLHLACRVHTVKQSKPGLAVHALRWERAWPRLCGLWRLIAC